jgi:hypothetical protein
MSGVGLVVLHREAGRGQKLDGAPGEGDLDDRVLAAMGDEHRQLGTRGEVRLPSRHGGDEAREGQDPRRRRALAVQAKGVAHDRPHREPAEDGVLGPDPSALPCGFMELGQRGARGVERIGIRIADARHGVPVVTGPPADGQRGPRGDDVQALLGIEHIGEPEEVVLVRSAPVVQHEQPLGLVGRRTLAIEQAHAHASCRAAARGLVRGVR